MKRNKKIIAQARPVRVAYLVDRNQSIDEQLAAISRNAFGRWSGRRSPIIPTTVEGVEEPYAEWLEKYDPDVVYSYVELSDDAVVAFHERYAPGDLCKHDVRGKQEGWRKFRVDFQLDPLHSISVARAVQQSRSDFLNPVNDLFIVDRFWDGSDSDFIRNNFGFISDTSQNAQIGQIAPDVFSCETLIRPDSLDNPQLRKSPNANYITDEHDLLRKIADDKSIVSVAQLSDAYSYFISPKTSWCTRGVSVFIGDTFEDKVAAWNAVGNYDRLGFREITTLYLSRDQARDDELLSLVWRLVDKRGDRDHQSGPYATLTSCSLSAEELVEISSKLVPEDQGYKRVTFANIPDATAVIPEFNAKHSRFTTGTFNEPKSEATWEFDGERSAIMLVRPWHIMEGRESSFLCQGSWMLDLRIDRKDDHSRYVNSNHYWHLPRRLRLDRSFDIERDWGSGHAVAKPICTRVELNGNLSISVSSDVRSAILNCPSDDVALGNSLVSSFEWPSFTRKGRAHRDRFSDIRYSDKGRYLLGILQHFEGLGEAIDVLMNSFWRDVFREMGADTTALDRNAVDRLIFTLRKRFGGASWQVAEGAEQEHIARRALQAASEIKRKRRFFKFREFKEKWEHRIDSDETIREGVRDSIKGEITSSVEFLCERRILFQGVDWKCQHCLHDNWTPIGKIDKTLECDVCREQRPAMVDGEWHFTLNSFLTTSYADHGTEPVVFALEYLWDKWDSRSFYFLPSIKLWVEGHHEDRPNDCEVDLLVVINGEVVAVEATTSNSLSDDEIRKLSLFSERARPNKFLIVCGASSKKQRDRIKERLEGSLPKGVACEVIEFKRETKGSLVPLPY